MNPPRIDEEAYADLVGEITIDGRSSMTNRPVQPVAFPNANASASHSDFPQPDITHFSNPSNHPK